MNKRIYYSCVYACLLLGLVWRRACLTYVTAAWLVQLCSAFLVWLHMQRPAYAAIDARYKRKYYHDCGVTILKPLHGAIPRLEETLETYFQLKWPRFELIFCVADANDDAVDVVRRLANKYPRVVQKVSVGNADYINPKLANLQSGYEAAKYDMVWMTDANVIASDGALQDMVDKCVGGSPLVHQVPWGISGPNITADFGTLFHGSVLERWFFATSHARPYVFLNHLVCTCLTGMSVLLDKSHLDDLGGLSVFASHINEDAKIGFAFDQRGWHTSLSKHPALQNLDVFDFDSYVQRRIRWMRLRHNCADTFVFIPLELLIDSHLFTLLAWTSLHLLHGFGRTWLVAHVAAWLLVDALVFCMMDRAISLPSAWQDRGSTAYFFDWGHVSDKPRGVLFFCLNLAQHYVMWVVRELVGVYVRVFALVNADTVEWRGTVLSTKTE